MYIASMMALMRVWSSLPTILKTLNGGIMICDLFDGHVLGRGPLDVP